MTTCRKRDKLIMVDNEKCILVDFPNDWIRTEGAVGYVCWLDKEYSPPEMQQIIKDGTEVIVHWPIAQIFTARAMKSVLKGLEDKEWEELVVTIRAIGSEYIYI